MKQTNKNRLALVIILGFLMVTSHSSHASVITYVNVDLEIHEIRIIEDHDNIALGKGDIYFQISVSGDVKFRYPGNGETVDLGNDEIWDVSALFPMYDLSRIDEITIEVLDSDNGEDDSLGSIVISKFNQSEIQQITGAPGHAEITSSVAVSEYTVTSNTTEGDFNELFVIIGVGSLILVIKSSRRTKI